MNKFFLAIGHFFANAQIWVSKEFEKIVGSKAATAFALGAEALLKSGLGKIVMAVVEAGATLEISGPAKAALALEQIPALALQAGITCSTSMINLLIETAVQKLKGSFGTDVPAAAAHVPDPAIKSVLGPSDPPAPTPIAASPDLPSSLPKSAVVPAAPVSAPAPALPSE